MQIRYNAQGKQRKAMAKLVGGALGCEPVKYLGTPTFSYQVGDFEITRDGTLTFPNTVKSGYVENIVGLLAKMGFENEQATEDISWVIAQFLEPTDEDKKTEPIGLSISLTRDSFTGDALKNLDGLLTSKGNLIKKAFDIDNISYMVINDRITFPWFENTEINAETAKAFQDFVGKLCELARKQKRVTARPREYENEKYAFRCFLLRLGLIGDEYKTTRKILLKNLSGNSSWRDGRRREAGRK